MMKRSLINRLASMTTIAMVIFLVAAVADAEPFQRYNPAQQPVASPRNVSRAMPSVVRGQIGGSGYSTPSLPSTTPSYAPAPYPNTSVPANNTYNNNTAPNQGWRSTGSTGTSPAANNNNYSASATNNGNYAAAGAYPQNNPTSQGYQTAPTSKPVGQGFPWIPGTGPPQVGGDPAGQGGVLPNWGGPDGGGIYSPTVDDYYRDIPRQYGRNDPRMLPIKIITQETQTGRLMFGVGVNSDAGLIGNIVLDEQNFDWTRFPRSFEDIRDATAWRGAGQRFRLEAVPGTQVQRYMATWQEPYLFGSRVSLGLSGNYFTRIYRDWTEDRVGGSVRLGYHLTHSLTGSIGFRGARVDVFNIANPAPQELAEVAGKNSLYGFQARLAHDTRDSTFLATEGHLIELGVEQVIGTYDYAKVDLDIRKYFMLRERPDGSGRHVLSLSYRVGWAGDDTPIYDHYFAGGFSTIRGFDYRGASPYDAATGVFVGGQFQMLASAEYLFPITADDMLRGVVFCDTGTVERTIDQWDDKYRVAPGFGLRITVPAMGPAPIALDFAFPVVKEDSDWTEVFSFFVGFSR